MNPKRHIPLIILLVLILIPFGRVFTHGEYLNGVSSFVSYVEPFASEFPEAKPGPGKFAVRKDGLLQILPSKVFTQDELKEGRWPLWNPHVFSGTPHQADMYSQVFSVTDTPLLLFLDVDTALTVAVLMKLLLLGLGMYFLALKLGCKWEYALISAVAMCFNFQMMQWLEVPAFLSTVLYLPWMFLAWERFLSTAKWKWVCVVAILGGLAALGGQMQIWVTIWIILFLYTLFFRNKHRPIKEISAIIPLILAAIAASAIGWVQIFPGMEFAKLSYGGENASFLDKLAYSLKGLSSGGFKQSARNILRLFAPYPYKSPGRDYYANHKELIIYLGLLAPAVLYTYWKIRKNNPLNSYFWWISIVSLGIMLLNLISEGILGLVPFPQFLSLRRMASLLFHFHMALLIPLALQYIFALGDSALGRKLITGLGVGILVVGGYLGFKWVVGIVPGSAAESAGFHWQFVIFHMISLILAVSYILIISREGFLKKRAPALILLIFFLEMWSYSSHQIIPSKIGTVELSSVNPFPGQIEEMRGKGERMVRYLDNNFLTPNTGMLLGLSDVQGYNPLNKRDYRRFYEGIFADQWVNPRVVPPIDKPVVHPRQLRAFFNARWVIQPEDKQLTLAENRVSDPGTDAGFPGRLVDLNGVSFDLHTIETKSSVAHVFTEWYEMASEEFLDKEFTSRGFLKENVAVTSGSIPSGIDRVLMFPHNNYPGWVVMVDGEEVDPLTLNGTFLGVGVQGEGHEIETVFDPPRFRIGLIVSVIALALSLLLFSIFSMRKSLIKKH